MLFRRKKKNPADLGDRRRAAKKGGVKKLFHGVAVRPRGDVACEAVKAVDSARYLSDEAPLLPLPDCSNPQSCRCIYEHFDERRGSLRRESDIGLPMRDHPNDRRKGHGRRITDG
ncbi:MAG: hypothetical protein AAF515_19565 [Pseudomonadota bacterium]